jgi:hypothetical protein
MVILLSIIYLLKLEIKNGGLTVSFESSIKYMIGDLNYKFTLQRGAFISPVRVRWVLTKLLFPG